MPGGGSGLQGLQDAMYGGQIDPLHWRVSTMGQVTPPTPWSEHVADNGRIRGTLSYGNDLADFFRANNNLTLSRILGPTSGAWRFGYPLLNPPSHGVGWPYPGFSGELHDSLGIPQATPFGVLPNALIYGHEHPETTLGGALGQWLAENNPMGWGR
jgi:hypothetical protein